MVPSLEVIVISLVSVILRILYTANWASFFEVVSIKIITFLKEVKRDLPELSEGLSGD